MDAFYASVEQRDNPSLRKKPVIVGGHPTRGVVLAASYEVRPFGVRSAMPMSRAIRAAPNAIVVPPRFSAYLEASEAVFGIFARYTPDIEALSLDEAFLDVTGSQTLFGAPSAIARRIRQEIAKEVNLPCSAGIAGVKFVAKIASDHAKPNGQHEVPSSETVAFLAPLPIARLWGVGPKTEERLRAMGLRTIGDIASKGRVFMAEYFGDHGVHLWELSNGIDARVVESDREAKSIGAEDTFEEDIPSGEDLHTHLHAQSLRVAARLRKAHLCTRVVQLKVKLADFTVLTRRATLDAPTDDGQRLYRTVVSLLQRTPQDAFVRLTGVSAQDIRPRAESPSLFPTESERQDRKRIALNRAMDAIHEKFGTTAVTTADLIDQEVDADDDEARRAMGAARFDRPKE
jgi:DNA polymerase-4